MTVKTKLITPRLELSLLTSSDVRRVLDFQLTNREFLAPTEPMRSRNYYSLNCQAKLLDEEYRKAVEQHTLFRYWITLKGMQEIIGSVLLANISYVKPASCFIAYRLAKEHQHKGHITEAAEKVLCYAFTSLGMEVIEANIMPRNKPSLAAARRMGFTVLGLRKKYLQIYGTEEDHIWTKLTRDQWNRQTKEKKL